MEKKDWVLWVTEYWKPFLTYVPTISLLVRGWIVFVFLEDAHASEVLSRLWRVGNGSLVLDRWHVNFDPTRERVQKRHLWALLSGLPFLLWNRSLLEGVGNTIGRFVALDDDFMNSFDKGKAKILVEMDISKGLPT